MNSGESSQFGKCGFGSLHNLTRVFHRGFSEFSLNNVFKLIDITGGTITVFGIPVFQNLISVII